MIICPQSDLQMMGHPDAERRLRRALAALRGAGIDAHGRIAHPDPYTAAMHAVQDERVDKIIVSTFPGARRSSWLRKDVVTRLRDRRSCRLSTSRSSPRPWELPHERARRGARASHGHAAANASSRVDARILGMLLFIGSEIMLFGSFFTAYFFVRVVNNPPHWPPHRLPPARLRGRASTR